MYRTVLTVHARDRRQCTRCDHLHDADLLVGQRSCRVRVQRQHSDKATCVNQRCAHAHTLSGRHTHFSKIERGIRVHDGFSVCRDPSRQRLTDGDRGSLQERSQLADHVGEDKGALTRRAIELGT